MTTSEPTPTRDEAVLDESKVTTAMIDAAFKVCPAGAIPEIGTGGMQRMIAAALAAAPAPASGGVDAVLNLYREAVRVDVKMEGPQFMGANSSALKRAWEADRASLSPAATPVSEAGGEAVKPDEWLRNNSTTLHEMYRSGDAVQLRFLSETLVRMLATLAKPASSPAGGDVPETLDEADPSGRIAAAIERAAQEGYRVCAETRHVTLGDKVRSAILALSQSTSAGRGE